MYARNAHINMQAKQAYTYSFLSCVSVLFVSVVWCVYMSEGEGEMFRCHGGQERVLDLELELQVVLNMLMWVLATDSGPLEEQQGFLTVEPLFQSQVSK